MTTTMRIGLAMLALAVSTASGVSGVEAATVQAGPGDEATLDAHRLDLETRIAAAERAGTLSHREAVRHRRALDAMIQSAKRDLNRPPHVVSAAHDAAYRRIIANAEAALAVGKDATAPGLIVTYTCTDAHVRERIIAETKRMGLTIGHDIRGMNRISVTARDGRSLDKAIGTYRKIPGVIGVDRDELLETQAAVSR